MYNICLEDNDELIGEQNKTISKATIASCSQKKVATPSNMIVSRPRDNYKESISSVVKQTTVQLQIIKKSVGN